METSKDMRYKSNGFTRKQLKGQGKGVDRWPMFYIRVELGEQNDPRNLERESMLNGVLKVLGAMVQDSLKTITFARGHSLIAHGNVQHH